MYLPSSQRVQADEPSDEACFPAAQLVLESAPLAEYFPPEHELHEVEAVMELKVPAEQVVQDDEDAVLNAPFGQTEHAVLAVPEE